VVFVPAGREDLIPWLQEGRGDLNVADLSITPERQKLVDFSDPMFTGIREIPVTGPGGPEIGTIDDLSGKELFVRRTSSYYEYLKALNERFAREGKAPVRVREAAEDLEAEDILGMVNAGLIGAEKIGGETVTYVSNIYKYYTTYKLIEAQEAERRKAREEVAK
jgi:ABC-type amino acid transport substrate-binding protein